MLFEKPLIDGLSRASYVIELRKDINISNQLLSNHLLGLTEALNNRKLLPSTIKW